MFDQVNQSFQFYSYISVNAYAQEIPVPPPVREMERAGISLVRSQVAVSRGFCYVGAGGQTGGRHFGI